MRVFWGVVLLLQASVPGAVAWADLSRPRALVVDYEMNPPVVLSRLLDDLNHAGFKPVYRPFYPQITQKDLRESSLLVVLSGDGPGYPGPRMSGHVLKPLEEFVRRGGALVLGPLDGGGADGAGDGERQLFNLLLYRLGLGIRIEDDGVTDQGDCFAGPLYKLPFARVAEWLPATFRPGQRTVTDRSPPLTVSGKRARALLSTIPSPPAEGDPPAAGGIPLVAVGSVGEGIVAVASRYLLTWGGGNGKEPATPLVPLVGEEGALRAFLRGLFVAMRHAHAFGGHFPRPPGDEMAPSPVEPGPERGGDRLPEAAPRGEPEVEGWHPATGPAAPAHGSHYRWIEQEGVRGGWAYVDRDPEEVGRLMRAMDRNGMNLLWGVVHPHLLSNPRGTTETKARVLSLWEDVASRMRGSRVRWFVGMEFPGRYASEEQMTRAVGAEGASWAIPSPWDLGLWRREVVRPAALVAQWATSHPEVAGIVLDLEMYGRKPLFFSQGVDYGDGPFLAFLEGLQGSMPDQGKGLPPAERFSWLRERGLLREYLLFLEGRSEEMGRELRHAVHSVHPQLILGCYSAGILHRWFYRGLWRGMSDPERPVLLFTFQRDVDMDLAELRAQGIHALHVRGLLMGMMSREDYVPLFQDALKRHAGYWLNRLTSLVARTGFYPVESPQGMNAGEAWEVIGQANRVTLVAPKGP
jgi:hypothetical protein